MPKKKKKNKKIFKKKKKKKKPQNLSFKFSKIKGLKFFETYGYAYALPEKSLYENT